MTTLKAWCIFSISVGLVASSPLWADLEFSVEPAVVVPGERARLVVRLPESDLQFPVGASEEHVPEAQDETLTQIQDLQLLDQDYRKVKSEFVWTYALTSYVPGIYTLPPIAIRFGPQSFSTQRLTLTVKDPRPPGDQTLRPNADDLSPPWSKAPLFWLFLAAVLGGLAYVFRDRLRPKPRPVEAPAPAPEPEEDPLDWLRKQLLILRARLDTSPQDPQAPDWWTAVVKEYAARVKRQPVRAWTTGEFAQRLEHDAKLSAIETLLRACDAVKFGHPNQTPAQTVKVILDWITETERLLL
ncbi:BatD family protein [bacterium]|nr:BatD family protein [bacterium]